MARMEKLWDTMLAVSDGYTGEEKSWSGLVGGDARRLEEAPALCGELMTQVTVSYTHLDVYKRQGISSCAGHEVPLLSGAAAQ